MQNQKHLDKTQCRGLTGIWVAVIVVVVLILAVIIAGCYYFAKEIALQTNNQTTNQQSSEDLDQVIKNYVLANSSGEIKDVVITDKKIFTDKNDTIWLKFSVDPIPGITDPAYGIMKKENGQWIGVGFGTCCIEQELPADIVVGLGFNTSVLDETESWQTYTNNEFGYSLKYPKNYKLSDQCYDSKTGKKIDYELMPKWLVIVSKNMDTNFPYCQSDFPAMDLIIRGSKSEININEMMETSDTDIESEEIINGINWAKQIMTEPSDFDGSYTTEFNTNHNGRGYTISVKNTDSSGTHDAEIDKIIEVFEFTN